MPRSQYGWSEGSPAVIKQHSIAKHEVLRSYLVAYLQTLVVNPGQDAVSVTLIDGFSGGGKYVHEDTGAQILGSPFVFLQSVEEARAILEIDRKKPLSWNVDYFFVEKDKSAFEYLRKALSEEGYGPRIEKDIHLLHGTFESHASGLVSAVKRKNPQSGRSIFLLDQYGYTDVPASQIRAIFATLPRAEVILTFAVDSFINYASDSHSTHKALSGIDIPNALRGRSISEIKSNEKDFRLYIQSQLYKELVDNCNSKYYTVFFIRTKGHGDYWLIHMSQHPRARDVMTTVHWEKNNNFIHYGGAGLEMFRTLGYDARNDSAFSGQSDLGFCFDETSSQASISALTEQLAPLVHEATDGVFYGDLFSQTCNGSPANGAKYKEALAHLVDCKEIEIVSNAGARRLRASTIRDGDILRPLQQRTFFLR